MTEIANAGQMIWQPDGPDHRALYLRHDASEPWRPYEDFPQYARSDPPEFSKGYATFLALLKEGWTAEPMARSLG